MKKIGKVTTIRDQMRVLMENPAIKEDMKQLKPIKNMLLSCQPGDSIMNYLKIEFHSGSGTLEEVKYMEEKLVQSSFLQDQILGLYLTLEPLKCMALYG